VRWLDDRVLETGKVEWFDKLKRHILEAIDHHYVGITFSIFVIALTCGLAELFICRHY